MNESAIKTSDRFYGFRRLMRLVKIALKRSYFLRGIVDNLPIGPSVATYASLVGLVTAKQGIGFGEMLAFNFLMFAGSAQLVIAEMWSHSVTLLEIASTAFIINFRYFLIGASLQSVFRGSKFWEMLLKMHYVADESWAVTMAKKGKMTPAQARSHLFGGGISLLTFWTVATWFGYVLGSLVTNPEKFGLDFAFAAVFTAIVVSLWRTKQQLVPWIIAGAVALACQNYIAGRWYIAIGGVVGAITQLLIVMANEKNEKEQQTGGSL